MALVATVLLAALVWFAGAPPGATLAASAGIPLALDGVHLRYSGPVPSGSFSAAQPGDAIQIATSSLPTPYQEVSIEAIPYGERSPFERLPQAGGGVEGRVRSALQAARVSDGWTVSAAENASLFGRSVAGLRSHARSTSMVPARPLTVLEWVAENDGRVWIVRVAYQDGLPRSRFEAPVSLATADSGVPTTVALAHHSASVSLPLPAPAWWGGTVCDANNYYAQTGWTSFARQANWQGLQSCGPGSISDNAPDALVHFFSGAWGEYEWECVELSMRWLYLAYGQAPYGANGSQVVGNYPGSALQKVSNGSGTLPSPGDVLSYGATSTAGHTSVVVAVNVTNGSGSVTVIEQNNSETGWNSISVSGGALVNTTATGWLHNPDGVQAGSGGDLRQFSPRPNSNGQWDAWDLTALGGGVQVAGRPFPSNGSVYARDGGGILRQFSPRPNSNGLWDAWDLSYGNGVRVAGSPFVADGSIYVRDTGGVLRQFAPRPNSNGQWDAWDLSYGNGVHVAGDPFVDIGSVYVVDQGGVLRQFSPRPNSNGQWDAWDLSYGNGVHVSGSPFVSNGSVYVVDQAGVLRQFSPRPNSNGQWDAWDLSYGNGVHVGGSPFVSNGSVYVVDQGGVLRQFSPASGGQWYAWDLSYGNGVHVSGSPFVFDGSVYVRDSGGILRQFSPASGGQWYAWDLSYGNGVHVSGDPYADGNVWISGA